MHSQTIITGRLLAAAALLIVVAALYILASRDVLTVESMVKYGATFQTFVANEYVFAAVSYIAVYVVVILILFPGALWFATLGGLMFGLGFGMVYASLAETIGTAGVFLLARYVFGHWIHLRAGHLLEKIRDGFRKDGFNYLLAIRLMPIFPFIAANVAPAALNVSLRTYVLATFIGLMPWTFMHVLVGVGLRDALRDGEVLSPMDILLRPKVVAGLLGLALLALVPLAYRRYKSHHDVHRAAE
jgi:uncharacterized membrane protein YdjX (TVP38/TMEM64 family)